MSNEDLPTTEEVRRAFATSEPFYYSEDEELFDRWLEQHDKEVISKAFHEWCDYQFEGLRFASTNQEDYDNVVTWTDAVKFYVKHVVNGEEYIPERKEEK